MIEDWEFSKYRIAFSFQKGEMVKVRKFKGNKWLIEFTQGLMLLFAVDECEQYLTAK